MAAARPVIGARVGGIPEMIVDGDTGVLIPSRDARRLADAIQSLVENPERARVMGRRGRDRAAEAFGVEAHARRVQAIYDRVLGS